MHDATAVRSISVAYRGRPNSSWPATARTASTVSLSPAARRNTREHFPHRRARQAHQALAQHLGRRPRQRAAAPGQVDRQPGRRRAGLRHARAHPAGRRRGHGKGRDALHADGRHAGAAPGHRRQARARERPRATSSNEIIATNGAKSAIYSALARSRWSRATRSSSRRPTGSRTPTWCSPATARPVTVACPEANGFKLTPAQLEAAITPRTRWLLINSPSNPTGASYTAAEYRALADVLARHPARDGDDRRHLRAHPLRRPAPRRTCSTAAPELRDRTLAINGVSKTYAMTGWRIGWAAGPRDLIQALDTLLSQSAGNCCSISQAAAAAALNGDQSFVAESVADLQAAARPHARAHQRDSRPELPRAGRRLLPLHQLRRPDRQDHARGQAPGRTTATW